MQVQELLEKWITIRIRRHTKIMIDKHIVDNMDSQGRKEAIYDFVARSVRNQIARDKEGK